MARVCSVCAVAVANDVAADGARLAMGRETRVSSRPNTNKERSRERIYKCMCRMTAEISYKRTLVHTRIVNAAAAASKDTRSIPLICKQAPCVCVCVRVWVTFDVSSRVCVCVRACSHVNVLASLPTIARLHNGSTWNKNHSRRAATDYSTRNTLTMCVSVLISIELTCARSAVLYFPFNYMGICL